MAIEEERRDVDVGPERRTGVLTLESPSLWFGRIATKISTSMSMEIKVVTHGKVDNYAAIRGSKVVY